MTAINFPNSPSDGDTHAGFVYNSTLGVWKSTPSSGGSSVSVSDTAPSSPSAGDLWWDSAGNIMFIYYTDTDSSQWVQTTTPGAPGSAGAAGANGTDGTDGTDGASGIVNTVYTEKTDTFSGVANGTPLLVTGMAASLTPASTSNKIHLTAQISYSQTGTTYKAWFKRTIGSGAATDVHIGDADGVRQRAGIPLALASDANQGNSFILQFIDEPATTEQVTYQLYVNNDNAVNFRLNRSQTDSNNNTGGRYISTIILQELGA